MYNLKQLRRLRWIVLAAVLLGIAASIAMNVLHAPDNLAAQLVSAGPPLAVFVSLELISRIPSTSRGLSWARVVGAAVVALGAAAISYWQQRSAVIDLGFQPWEATIWPTIIDGSMIVASVSLVEVVRKIRQLAEPAPTAQLRGVVDQFESPAALAYRAARAQLGRGEVAVNGSKPA